MSADRHSDPSPQEAPAPWLDEPVAVGPAPTRREGWTAYCDVETATAAEVLAERLHAACLAGEVADTAAAVAWVNEHAADEALNPVDACITVWAVAGSDGVDFVDDATGPGGERGLLERLHVALRGASRIVAHGMFSMESPFIRSRAGHHNLDELAALFFQEKPWGERLVDTSMPPWCPRPPHAVKGWRYNLDDMCRLYGIPRKPTVPGKECPARWYRGEVVPVREHCLSDAQDLRALTRRLAAGRRA